MRFISRLHFEQIITGVPNPGVSFVWKEESQCQYIWPGTFELIEKSRPFFFFFFFSSLETDMAILELSKLTLFKLKDWKDVTHKLGSLSFSFPISCYSKPLASDFTGSALVFLCWHLPTGQQSSVRGGFPAFLAIPTPPQREPTWECFIWPVKH